MTAADRGKKAEGKLQKAFDKLEASRQDFCYERIYDARSSMGKMSNPRVGDFVLYHQGRNVIVEVKEVAHDYRLPCGNFDRGQRARLRKRQLAGSICAILVYHSTTDVWRIATLDFFGTKDQGSWDFRETPECTLDTVLDVLVNKWSLL